MLRRMSRALLAVPLLALMAPGWASAQQQPEPQVQQWAAELQQIQMQLQPLQERALEDEQLREQRDATTETLRAAMLAVDPEVGASLDRLERMMEEVQQAQEARDAERLMALNQEAQQIQPRIAAAQQQALQQEEVQQTIEAFQTNLRARMVELDPESATLFQRAEELEQRIRGAG